MTDVITNSSTSIYTVAGKYTISTIKEIIDTLLEIGGSSLTADDLFTIKLAKPSYWEDNDLFYQKCLDYVVDNVLTKEEYQKYESLTKESREEQDKVEYKDR